MNELDLVVRGGTVATATAVVPADVGIRGERVVALGTGLPPGRREIDAADRLVLPGGVDSHCHIEQLTASGLMNADTFETATGSAALGGTTTVIPFAAQHAGMSLARVVEDYHAAAARGALVDYAFHMILCDPRPEVLAEELPPLARSGHGSLKVFLTYDRLRVEDEQFLDVLEAARRHGLMVCVHAENHGMITWMGRRLLEGGYRAPLYHVPSHPRLGEVEAIGRAIACAALVDQPLMIFHVSTAEGAAVIHRARGEGRKVWGETCTQYLVLTADDLDKPGFEGAKALCSPAPRSRADQAALWEAIRLGTLGNVTSDHAPTRYDGPDGKTAVGLDAPFTEIPNGVPGLAARMPILFSEGVAKGRITLPQFVAITATNAAKLFGLHPRKGTIAVGADADLAVWDPGRKVTITNALLQDANDHTPYEGLEFTGWPETTLVRGVPVAEGGRVVAPPGHGQWLPRGHYELIRPRGVFPGPFNPVDRVPVEEGG